jgi:hypothetical protein
MMLLSEIIERLSEDVPAQDGVPSASQYERAVKDAVADFGRRAGRVKRSTLNIIAGTASYDLPDDFLSMIAMSGIVSADGVLNTSYGLIPVSAGFAESFTIANRVITFSPTPTYSVSRAYRYKAGWAISGADEQAGYEDMSEDEAAIVLLKAKALAVGKIAAAAAGEGGFSYRQGDVTVDLAGHVSGLQASALALDTEYLAAVEIYVGTVLVMG